MSSIGQWYYIPSKQRCHSSHEKFFLWRGHFSDVNKAVNEQSSSLPAPLNHSFSLKKVTKFIIRPSPGPLAGCRNQAQVAMIGDRANRHQQSCPKNPPLLVTSFVYNNFVSEPRCTQFLFVNKKTAHRTCNDNSFQSKTPFL